MKIYQKWNLLGTVNGFDYNKKARVILFFGHTFFLKNQLTCWKCCINWTYFACYFILTQFSKGTYDCGIWLGLGLRGVAFLFNPVINIAPCVHAKFNKRGVFIIIIIFGSKNNTLCSYVGIDAMYLNGTYRYQIQTRKHLLHTVLKTYQ